MSCESERSKIAETLAMFQMLVAEPDCVTRQLERIRNGGDKEVHEGVLTLRFLKERLEKEGCLNKQLIDFWAGKIGGLRGDEMISQFLAFVRTLRDGGKEKKLSVINGWGVFWQQPNNIKS